MARVNKFLYGWKFYLNYGQGWEYEIFEETFKGMKENRKAYRENCDYPLKISRGRETNPKHPDNQAQA
jgi:hypothetical protein